MVGVSKTAVSSIINEAKLQDPNYALMHALVVNLLAKNGSDVFQYASCVRILILIHIQLGANDAEEIIRHLLPALYKARWTVANAIDGLQKFENSAKEFGHTPWEHWAILKSFEVK